MNAGEWHDDLINIPIDRTNQAPQVQACKWVYYKWYLIPSFNIGIWGENNKYIYYWIKMIMCVLFGINNYGNCMRHLYII